MAESFSVKAILSAKDSGFSSVFKSASSTLDSLKSKITSGIGFGVLTGIGQKAFDTLSGGMKDLVGEINASNKAWKTFDGNMAILGKEKKEIRSVKKTLKDYAQTTIYSSSDMASSYAQLAAVGIKSADKLVTGFGGLAGAAENPAQAMKTLSQQGVQMAAKPKVAWQDFKLMLEQTPAGMAAVAKQMNMTTSELVTAVQDGKVKTEAFFKAVDQVGNGKGFKDLATQYKSVDQAMDGLKETLGNKLLPAFDALSKFGIKSVSKLIDKVDGINGNKIAKKLTAGLKTAKTYWDTFISSFDGVGSSIKSAFDSVKEGVQTAFGDATPLESFKSICEKVAEKIKTVSDFIAEHGDLIGKALPKVVKLAVAFKGFKIISPLIPGVVGFTKGILGLAGKGVGGIAKKLFGISRSQKKVGETSQISGGQMLGSAKAYALMGVAVFLIAASFALLAYSAIQLANAGGLAIGVMAGLVVGVAALGFGMAILLKSLAPMSGQLMPVATAMLAMGAAVLLISLGFAALAATSIMLANAGGAAIGIMVGMVAAIALLAVGAAALGASLTAGALGFIAFGAAVFLVGAGFALIGVAALLAAQALSVVAGVLPSIAEYGTQGAVAILALGGSLIVFGVGAAVAGAACIVLGAGLIVAAVGVAALALGVTALAIGVGLAAVALMLAAGGLALLNLALPATIANGAAASVAMMTLSAGLLALGAGALVAGAGVVVLGAGLLVASAGLVAFGAAATVASGGTLILKAALKGVESRMKNIAENAKDTEKALKDMNHACNAVEIGLSAIGEKAKSAMKSLFDVFDNTAKKAKEAGEKTGADYANGLTDGMNNATVAATASTAKIISLLTATATSAASSGLMFGNSFAMAVNNGMLLAVSYSSTGVSAVIVKLREGYSGAYNAGAYISMGFANGMKSQLYVIRSAAAQMAAAADAAVRAKARIHSPSKVADKLGVYWGEGYARGIERTENDVWNASQSLVSIPNISAPDFSGKYSGELSEDVDYYRNAEYIFTIPFDIDGREFAKATVKYSQDELDRMQTRTNRKTGKV